MINLTLFGGSVPVVPLEAAGKGQTVHGGRRPGVLGLNHHVHVRVRAARVPGRRASVRGTASLLQLSGSREATAAPFAPALRRRGDAGTPAARGGGEAGKRGGGGEGGRLVPRHVGVDVLSCLLACPRAAAKSLRVQC